MAAEEPPVWYEELTDIELDFENAEVEISEYICRSFN